MIILYTELLVPASNVWATIVEWVFHTCNDAVLGFDSITGMILARPLLLVGYNIFSWTESF